jgi:hypothetical protein
VVNDWNAKHSSKMNVGDRLGVDLWVWPDEKDDDWVV